MSLLPSAGYKGKVDFKLGFSRFESMTLEQGGQKIECLVADLIIKDAGLWILTGCHRAAASR